MSKRASREKDDSTRERDNACVGCTKWPLDARTSRKTALGRKRLTSCRTDRRHWRRLLNRRRSLFDSVHEITASLDMGYLLLHVHLVPPPLLALSRSFATVWSDGRDCAAMMFPRVQTHRYGCCIRSAANYASSYMSQAIVLFLVCLFIYHRTILLQSSSQTLHGFISFSIVIALDLCHAFLSGASFAR